jgi:hypothetical protein
VATRHVVATLAVPREDTVTWTRRAWIEARHVLTTAGYLLRPYDMLADSRRWAWTPHLLQVRQAGLEVDAPEEDTMTRHQITLTMRPPCWIQRVWYRRLGLTPPLATGSTGKPLADYVRLLPYRWRWFHRWYAARYHFYWLPCPLCARPYGGHEGGGSIPDPIKGPGRCITICSDCTRAGKAM